MVFYEDEPLKLNDQAWEISTVLYHYEKWVLIGWSTFSMVSMLLSLGIREIDRVGIEYWVGR